MEEKKKKKFIPIIFSALLHMGLIAFLIVTDNEFQHTPPENVEIEWVDIQDLPSQEDRKRQIVQQDDKSINEKVPEKDYKLSQINQEVLKETKAQKQGEFQNRKNKTQGEAKPVAQTKPASKRPPKLNLENLKPALFDDQFSQAKLAPPPTPALSGSEVSQNDDYLSDVVAGAETHLNTREFVYYSYYNRIKKKLRFHWEPRIKKKIVKILRKGRKIASATDKITRLVITLDKQGTLVRIQVKNASGYNDLDDAAIEAFRAAAPFPNPPQGIVDGTGEVQINWDFVLET